VISATNTNNGGGMETRIFETLQDSCQKGIFTVPTTFYFSIDDTRKTLTLDSDGCRVQNGKAVENAD
jgi:hypothetical protein